MFVLYKVSDGTSFVTMLPAAIIAFSPIIIPGRIVAFAPIDAPFFTTVCKNFSGYFFERGYKSFVNVTFGPMKTLSSIQIPSQS